MSLLLHVKDNITQHSCRNMYHSLSGFSTMSIKYIRNCRYFGCRLEEETLSKTEFPATNTLGLYLFVSRTNLRCVSV